MNYDKKKIEVPLPSWYNPYDADDEVTRQAVEDHGSGTGSYNVTLTPDKVIFKGEDSVAAAKNLQNTITKPYN